VTAVFVAILRRDLLLAARIGGAAGLGLVFFLAVVVLIPFGLGPDLNLLSRIGPAILWIASVLATLIGLDRLFQADAEDGSLDQMRLSPAPLEVIVGAKIAAHWLSTGLPLALAAPALGLLLASEPATLARTALALALGTPALTAVGAVGAALTATLRRGGLVLAILVVPLMIPTLIFGVAASDPAGAGAGPAMLVLAGLTLGALAVGTVGAAAALRSLE
jgi:heme exporter protein B